MSKQIMRCPKCGEKESIGIEVRNRMCYPKMAVCMRCNYRSHRWEFEPFVPTVFDRITTPPEVLAPCFVEKQPDQWDDDDYAYYSYLTKEWYATETEAIAATVAKLNEVCDE